MKKLKDLLNESLSEFGLDTYKIADSFTPQELKKLKADGKISAESLNGALELQRGWKQRHPSMTVGGGNYKQDMLKKLNKVNEAEFKFKSISKALDYIQDLRGQSMDLEQTMRSTLADLQDVQMDMEQEAEPEGGPIADKYAREMAYHKRQYNKTKAEFEKVMDEIEKFDANYMG